jgi:hypothetical protein
MLLSAFQNMQHIVVVREGRKLTLPPAGGNIPTAAESGTSGAKSASGNPLQDQLDAVQKVPTH